MLKVMKRRSLSSTVYILLAASFLVVTFGLTSLAHADNPSNVDYNVYVKPSLSIIASSNTVAIDLNPNSKQFGTANLDVTVGTNNQYGYKLFMNTDSNTTSLERNQDPSGSGTPDGIAASIPTLSNGSSANPCASSYTASTFTTNSWGYRINNNVDGEASCVDTTGTNFYSYTPGTLISSSNQASNNKTANLTFGAKIDYNKPAGEYDLTLKFKALPTVTTYYMQDIADTPSLASTICTEEPTVVLDKRDEQSYTIRRINGDCWMVENLQFTGTTMDSTTSNISPQYTPSNPYRVNNGNGYYNFSTDATSGGKCYADNTSGDGFDYACIQKGIVNNSMSPIDDSTTAQSNISAIWYNYAAASAGTTVGVSNSSPTEYDICPAGWKLPNYAQASGLIAAIGTAPNIFNPIASGFYDNQTLEYNNVSGWWWMNTSQRSTSTNDPTKTRDALRYYTLDGLTVNTGGRGRNGFHIRCILKNFNINDLSHMQDFARITESDAATGDNKKQQVIDSMELNSTTGYNLKDTRDTNTYTINKIGPANDTSKQNVWMTKNLLFQGTTLNPTDTDVTTTRYINGSNVKAYYNLVTQSSTTTDYCRDDYAGNSPGYINACTYYTTSDSNIGNIPNAWYNYAAASAGTITGTSNSATATESICPKGWAMPDQSQVESIGNGTSTYIPIFKPVGGGFYDNSVPSLLDRGYYWSRVILDSGINRYYLGYYSAEPANLGAWGSTRAGGRYVRCVAR